MVLVFCLVEVGYGKVFKTTNIYNQTLAARPKFNHHYFPYLQPMPDKSKNPKRYIASKSRGHHGSSFDIMDPDLRRRLKEVRETIQRLRSSGKNPERLQRLIQKKDRLKEITRTDPYRLKRERRLVKKIEKAHRDGYTDPDIIHVSGVKPQHLFQIKKGGSFSEKMELAILKGIDILDSFKTRKKRMRFLRKEIQRAKKYPWFNQKEVASFSGTRPRNISRLLNKKIKDKDIHISIPKQIKILKTLLSLYSEFGDKGINWKHHWFEENKYYLPRLEALTEDFERIGRERNWSKAFVDYLNLSLTEMIHNGIATRSGRVHFYYKTTKSHLELKVKNYVQKGEKQVFIEKFLNPTLPEGVLPKSGYGIFITDDVAKSWQGELKLLPSEDNEVIIYLKFDLDKISKTSYHEPAITFADAEHYPNLKSA